MVLKRAVQISISADDNSLEGAKPNKFTIMVNILVYLFWLFSIHSNIWFVFPQNKIIWLIILLLPFFPANECEYFYVKHNQVSF